MNLLLRSLKIHLSKMLNTHQSLNRGAVLELDPTYVDAIVQLATRVGAFSIRNTPWYIMYMSWMEEASLPCRLITNWRWWKMINASITASLDYKLAVTRYYHHRHKLVNDIVSLLLTFCPWHPKWVVMRLYELEVKTGKKIDVEASQITRREPSYSHSPRNYNTTILS